LEFTWAGWTATTTLDLRYNHLNASVKGMTDG
jgi:hypothetical protein